jgi:hypothetical protein
VSELSGDDLPRDDEWIDVGGGVRITAPEPMTHEGKEYLGSWWSHTRPGDGRQDGWARMLFGGPFHVLVSTDPLTIEPSILCGSIGRPDVGCGRHGYIRDGRWIDAG